MLAVLLPSVLLFSQQVYASQDADFLAARDAFRAGDATRLDRMAVKLKHTLLEPYLAYYQLRLRLTTTNHKIIQQFLGRNDDTQIINQMRAEWLKMLGEHRRWELFAAEYVKLKDPDIELTCYDWQMQLMHKTTDVLGKIRDLWLTSSEELPKNCMSLLNTAQANGVITPADIGIHIRRALEVNNIALAMQLAKTLPKSSAPAESALRSAAKQPMRYLAQLTSGDKIHAGQRIAAIFALQYLARQSPQLAYEQWEKIAPHFNAEEHGYFYGWLGLEAARKHDERALEWYKAAGDSPLTDLQLAWRTRAALRAQNWPEILHSATNMSPAQQQETVWKYWKARALRALGQTNEATIIFTELSEKHDFYGQLAAEEIGRMPAVDTISTDVQANQDELTALRTQPGIQRVIALYRMGLRTEAVKEWAWVTRDFKDTQLLLAAEIARDHKMHDYVINTADRTVQQHDFNMRFHAPYRGAVQQHILTHGLEEAWVYGLMRQESRFVDKAKSVAGAAGFMQIMPATARWAAQKIGMKNYRKDSLYEMDTNLKLGMYYMKSMLSSLDNSLVLASAAYNAGPNRARKWRAKNAMEGAIYIETIPFDETRNYVKKVISNTVHYARVFGHSPMQLKQRLDIVKAVVNVTAGANPAIPQ
ncbi:MAG: transglycosylase SLT domain-containing protein [Candidatus Nitrotoga sp.]